MEQLDFHFMTEPHIEAALTKWRETNATKSRWATFEADENGVRVEVGSKFNGIMERSIITYTYHLLPDDKVVIISAVHS